MVSILHAFCLCRKLLQYSSIYFLVIDRLITKSHINIHSKIVLKTEADMHRLR